MASTGGSESRSQVVTTPYCYSESSRFNCHSAYWGITLISLIPLGKYQNFKFGHDRFSHHPIDFINHWQHHRLCRNSRWEYHPDIFLEGLRKITKHLFFFKSSSRGWFHSARRPLLDYCTCPGDCEDGEFGGMNGFGRGNWSIQRKHAPVPLCPPKIPFDQTRARTRAAAVGSQLLTASATDRPTKHLRQDNQFEAQIWTLVQNTYCLRSLEHWFEPHSGNGYQRLLCVSVVLYRHRLCDGAIPHPRNPIKYL
jgi:hypothetical protein